MAVLLVFAGFCWFLLVFAGFFGVLEGGEGHAPEGSIVVMPIWLLRLGWVIFRARYETDWSKALFYA